MGGHTRQLLRGTRHPPAAARAWQQGVMDSSSGREIAGITPTEMTIQTEASPRNSYVWLMTMNSMPSPIAVAICIKAQQHMRSIWEDSTDFNDGCSI